MAEIKGFHRKVENIYFFFGEVTEFIAGSGEYKDVVTNVKLKSSYFCRETGKQEDILNTIAFWDEPQKVVGNNVFKEKKLSTQIQKSKVGDKLLLKCYVYDDGRIKAQQIAYPSSCLPVKRGEVNTNLVYGVAKYPKMGEDGRFRFKVPCSLFENGAYNKVFLSLTVDCSEQFNNLAVRASKLIQEGRTVLCDISDIKSSEYTGKDGQRKKGYSAWLSSFSVIF